MPFFIDSTFLNFFIVFLLNDIFDSGSFWKFQV